jgi:hypothetical protein
LICNGTQGGNWIKKRKRFFFEKKKQKTFFNPGQWPFHQHGLQEQKFFARFFSKKRCLLPAFLSSGSFPASSDWLDLTVWCGAFVN